MVWYYPWTTWKSVYDTTNNNVFTVYIYSRTSDENQSTDTTNNNVFTVEPRISCSLALG
jgi:hypothetical protein